jgi:predicted DNA-binding transcriptional regulator AlpA
MNALRVKHVLGKAKFSRSTLYERMRDEVDPFPHPFPLGEKAVAWDEQEVDAWLERQKAKRVWQPPQVVEAAD